MRQSILVAVLGILGVARSAGAIKCTTPAQCCAAAKIIAVSVAAAGQAKCYDAVALNPDGHVDPSCLDKARAKLVKAFEKAEAAGGCATVGDANAINTRVIDVFGVRIAPQFPPTPDPPTCDCGAVPHARLALTTQPSSGECGTVHDTNNAIRNLDCGSVYTGGGGADVHFLIGIGHSQYANVASCTGSRLELAPTTAAQVGSKFCTSANCAFGPPFETGPACVVVTVRYDLTGTADCRTGELNFAEPVKADVYPAPCPICSGGVCNSGARAGLACTDPSGSWSADCLPSPGSFLATAFNFNFVNTTGTQTRAPLATGQSQVNTFCGFCRNPGDLLFEDPPHQCVLDSECTNGVYTRCQQYTGGAFGNPLADSITMTGALAGDLTDGAGHTGIIASAFCIGPTQNGAVNSTGNIPSPGTTSAFTQLQLLGSPSGAFVDLAVQPSPREGR